MAEGNEVVGKGWAGYKLGTCSFTAINVAGGLLHKDYMLARSQSLTPIA